MTTTAFRRLLRSLVATPRRLVLLGLGLLVLAGGGSIAYAAAAHHADRTPVVFRGATGAAGPGTRPHAAATEDAKVQALRDGLTSFLATLNDIKAANDIAKETPFGGSSDIDAAYQQLTSWVATAQAKIKSVSDQAGETLTKLDAQLDDLNGDGDTTSDIDGLKGAKVDLDVDISPKAPAAAYDATVKLKVAVDKQGALAFLASGLTINGQKISDGLTFSLQTVLHIDPTGAKKFTIKTPTGPIAHIDLAAAGTFDGDKNPLAFNVGLLQVTAKGSVTAGVGVTVNLVDANKDGVIDPSELAKPADLFSTSCESSGAKADLTVTGSLAGLGGKNGYTVGHVGLDDKNLCDGISAPDVQLGDLAQFRNLTLGDLINGLAQVTQAIQTAQTAGDLKLPFLKQPLSKLVSFNQDLVKFFVDNGFTDPKNPMAKITVDTSSAQLITSLQTLAPKLESALNLPAGSLAMHYESGRILFKVQKSSDPAAAAKTASVDLGDSLKNTGITGFTGSASASVAANYSLDFGFGFDLNPDTPLGDRFFLTNGGTSSNPTLFTADANVTADLNLNAVLSILGVTLTTHDATHTAPVALLIRKNSALPMLSVKLVDPNNDGRVTLNELSNTLGGQATPIKATVNAQVPSTTLHATANVVGNQIGSGAITVAWPDVTDTSGLKVTEDSAFTNIALPFAFDPSDPKALVSKILQATRETISRIRGAVASGDATTSTPLPLIGKSVADLDPVLAKVQNSLDDLINVNDSLTLDNLQNKMDELLSKALGAAGPSKVVALSYLPRTATTPAAVLVKLNLGACTPARAAKFPTACTVTTGTLSEPFNLNLGTGSKLGGVAGVGAQGDVSIDFDARASLTLGVQLPKVEAGSSATDLPTVTGTPSLFVQDDSGFEVGLGAKLDGVLQVGLGPVQASLGAADNHATAGVTARFALKKAGAKGDRITILDSNGSPTSAFSDFLSALVPHDGLTIHETNTDLQVKCNGTVVDACAALPVYVGSTNLGTINLSAPNLLDPSGWTVDAASVESALSHDNIKFQLIYEGVQTLVNQLQDGLHNLPSGTKIPLLGTDVTAGADVIGKFNTDVMPKIKQMAEVLDNSLTVDGLKKQANDLLNQIDILNSKGRIVLSVSCLDPQSTVYDCKGNETLDKIESFEVHLPLSAGITKTVPPFDIGFPGLRLGTQGKLSGSASLNMNLAFGIDRELGFYIPTGGDTPELSVSASASLPHVDNGPDMTGELAFLPIAIKDAHAAGNTNPSIGVVAGLKLKTARPDGRLTLQDLGSATIEPSVTATPDVDLDITTVKPPVAPSGLPTFHTELKIDGQLKFDGSGQLQNTLGIHFDHVSVDAGSLVTDFIKPAAQTLHKFTQPLEKPIAKLREKVPGLADAAKIAGKHQYTWYELLQEADKAMHGGESSGGMELIDHVMKLVDLVQAVDNDSSPNGTIDIGSFDVSPETASKPVPQNNAGSMITSSTLDTTDVMSDIGSFQGSDVLDSAEDDGGLSFPAFDHPSTLFQMLLGKDVPLVYFDAGKLGVNMSMQFSYPIGPAQLYIGGSIGVSGHFAAGFDTYGLRQGFAALTDPDSSGVQKGFNVAAGLLQGLYLDDLDKNGVDVPEISIGGELTVGASLGIPGFSVGAEGGIAAHADFNLHTEDSQDHKVRFLDIVKQFQTNPNPLCLFDVSAQIDAFVRLVVDTPLGKSVYPIVSGTPWKEDNLTAFCRTKTDADKPHLLADVGKDGTLTLKTNDDDQDIEATQVKPGSVELLANGIDETYTGVKRVFADLKAGNDTMTVHQGPDVTDTLPVLVCGGAGDDRIAADTGPVELFGDGGGKGCAAVTAAQSGRDVLQGGASADTLDGGAGDDSLDGGAGADTLLGQAGNDVLRGGTGSDTIAAGDGNDTIDYSDHTAPVTIDVDRTSGSAGEKDTMSGVENVYGSSQNDDITLPATGTLRIDGGVGDDTIKAGKSTALIMSGDGNDTIIGGEGKSQIVAGNGDDTFVDGPGAQSFLGQGGKDTADYSQAPKKVTITLDGVANDGPDGSDNIADADVVIGSKYDDHLTGGSGDEELRGNDGADHLEGGPGGDTLLGGAGNDLLEGNSGNDRLNGGAGDDTLIGGPGGDDLVGGTDADTADYSDRTDDLTITKDNVANDGSYAGDSSDDNVHTDIETIIGGSGGDTITGWSGTDTIIGNAGRNNLNGNGGADKLVGGPDHDVLCDLTFNQRGQGGDTSNDVFIGGAGQDDMYGNGGADRFEGGDGADYIIAGDGPDTILGGNDPDSIYGGGGADTIDGGEGDDSISGGPGDDVIHGGAGQPGEAAGRGTIRGGDGDDTVYAEANGGTIYTGGDNSPETDHGPNTVYGSSVIDNVTGSEGPDTMHLAGGDDLVHAGGGDDVLDLGDGKNTAYGEAGNDTITGGADNDVVHAGAGNDTLYGGGGDDTLEGEGDDDTIYGQAGNDGDLGGGPGNDVIDGGTGADSMSGGDGTDTVTYADRKDTVVVNDNGNHQDGDASDAATPGGTSGADYVNYDVEKVIGGSGNDRLTAASGSYRTGSVELDGGPGDDTLTVSTTVALPAVLDGGPGNDVETGGSGADTFVQGSAADGGDDLHGGDGDDTVDYSKRPADTAFVNLDDLANDGAGGEHDNVHTDVEHALGAVGGSAPTPTVSVGAARVAEGKAGSRTVVKVPVRLSNPSNDDVTVPYSLVAGTATAGKDYLAAKGSVTVASGATAATIAVTVLGDNLDEPNETVTVKLGEPSRAKLGVPTATLTITDDDAAPKVSVRDASVNEGAKGRTTMLRFTVTLSAASGQRVTVHAATSNGTARAGSDYRALAETITFAAGQTTKTVNVTVLGDKVKEKNETLRLTLSKLVDAAGGDTRATGTIRNDDR